MDDNMNRLGLVDGTFSHSVLGYCSDYQISDIFRWDRQNTSGDVVYTDMLLNRVSENIYGDNYAWLIEPIEVAPQNYRLIEKLEGNFKKIYTHEKTLLSKGEPYVLLPFGCCWVVKEDHRIYEKHKDISIVASNKRITSGHNLRHSVINSFNGYFDVYGRGYNNIPNKLDGLKDYRFSIVIENCKRDYWFTEKLIDCFVTGTIPIYWGCPSIGEFFNIDGIITFDTLDELSEILNRIKVDPVSEYNNRLPYVVDNLNNSRQYLLPDDNIYKHIYSNEHINPTH